MSIALSALAHYWRERFTAQAVCQLLLDLFVVTALMELAGGMSSGLATLYLLPLAGASLLLSTITTFSLCSLAVIAILMDAFVRHLRHDVGGESLLFQSGLYGAALFGVTILLSLLAGRLANQEKLASLRGRDLENQLQINRLVIAHMDQGVLVVDAHTQVRANNRASRRLLGMGYGAQLTGQKLTETPNAAALGRAFLAWVEATQEGAASADAARNGGNTVAPGVGRAATAAVHIMPEEQLRARFARPPAQDSGEFVIFLEDVRAVEERAQQLKLAAMGRLTASIAHEIRNPLAAISHAGQLLAEDAQEPMLVKLAGIVRENTRRLDRLVDDVLRVARREPPQGDEFDLAEFVNSWLVEFVRDRSIEPERIRVFTQPDMLVKFETTHLRQVLFNLTDNALRYASGRAGSVEVRVEHGGELASRPRLWVFDDGVGVAPEAHAALFEPFYTTHARGTGLGLYLAREFCIANRADLGYDGLRQLDGSTRYGFVVQFARASGARLEDVGFLDTMPAR